MLPGSPTGHRPGSSVLEVALVRFSDEAAVGPVAFPDGRRHLRDGCGTLGPVAAFDVTRPNTARMYDYWLGGKDSFEVDREAAEAVRASRPDVSDLALENKKFLTRAVGYVAGQGVSQFVDVGSGVRTSPLRAPGASPFWLG